VVQAQDRGSGWWQWRVLTALILIGAPGAFVTLTGLPMFLFVRCAQRIQ
jgi:hypothetical protein